MGNVLLAASLNENLQEIINKLITMTCDNNVTAVKIKPEAVDPDDVEMLEDLVIAADRKSVV